MSNTEIDSYDYRWTWCDNCNEMKPLIHDCSDDTLSINDIETETIDYYSVEAALRGWIGARNQQIAQRQVKNGTVKRSETKITKFKSWIG